MPALFNRIQLFADPEDTERIAGALAAILQQEPRPLPMTRLDGSSVARIDFVSAGISIESMPDPHPQVTAMLAFTVPDQDGLDAAVERLSEKGFNPVRCGRPTRYGATTLPAPPIRVTQWPEVMGLVCRTSGGRRPSDLSGAPRTTSSGASPT